MVFTAVDENELEVVQKASKVAEKSSENYDHVQEKIDALYNAIIPLLNNLKKNPREGNISSGQIELKRLMSLKTIYVEFIIRRPLLLSEFRV